MRLLNIWDRIGSKADVVGYGHIGDGNLHLNVSTPKYDNEVFNLIEPYLFEWIAKHRGSISAEHGIGVSKPDFLHFSKSLPAIQMMKSIKNTLDPNGILNPYKVFPRNMKWMINYFEYNFQLYWISNDSSIANSFYQQDRIYK